MLITKINNATDALAALNENFEKLVTDKRKVLVAKEVNNTIGKMTNIVKEQAKELDRIGDKGTRLPWLDLKNVIKSKS